jgi:hypothetical protein
MGEGGVLEKTAKMHRAQRREKKRREKKRKTQRNEATKYIH